MGVVYVAEDTKLNRIVALKFLSENAAADRRAAAHFRNEALMASGISHPNICTVYGTEEVGTRQFIVMEYVEGKTLKRFVGGRPLDIHTLLALALQIADALDCAHSRGILHCDIKPSNIKVTPQNQVKLLDFGIAKKAPGTRPATQGFSSTPRDEPGEGSGAGAEAQMGTVGYMSPEQTMGKKLDPRTDLFSFGAVLYEMCTGTQAFKGATDAAISDAVLHKSPVPASRLVPELPSSLQQIVARALQKDRELRYQSAADMRSDLRRVEREIDSENPTSPGSFHPRPRAFPWRTGLEVAGLFLLVLTLVLGWYLGKSAWHKPELQISPLTANSREMPILAAAISPDGRNLVFSDDSGLYLQIIASSEVYALPVPEQSIVSSIAWFPNQDKLLVGCTGRGELSFSLWAVSIYDRTVVKLRDGADSGTVTQAESEIAFISENKKEIWVMGMHGEDARQVCSAPRGSSFRTLAWFPKGDRLLYAIDAFSPHSSTRIESRTLQGSVTEIVSDPALRAHLLLPDGQLIYSLSTSPPAAAETTLYKVQLNGDTGQPMTSPERLASFTGSSVVGISGATNGRRVAVLREVAQADVYVGKLAQQGTALEQSRRLTMHDRDDIPLAWTPDNKTVLFASDRAGKWDVFRQSLSERTATRLISNLESVSSIQLGPEGDFVLYCPEVPALSENSVAQKTLLRISLSGGLPQVVSPPGHFRGTFGCARLPSTRCVIAEPDSHETVFYSLDPSRGIGKELARLALDPVAPASWSVSPDGSRLAVSSLTENGQKIAFLTLADNSQRDLSVAGRFGFQALYWNATGTGVYVSDRSYSGSDLLHIDLNGRVTLLRHQSSNWYVRGIPSPDGRLLAFTEWSSDKNVWLIDNF